MLAYARWTAPRSVRTGFWALCLALPALLAPAFAAADSVQIDLQLNPERGFQVIQELSYEAIVLGTDGYRADLHLRVALHNASNRPQDAVLSLALPRGAEIHGLQVAKNGLWTPGLPTGLAAEPDRREPGTVFVRPLAPVASGDLPGAEIVAFSLEPATTTQVELALKVPIRLRGDRWELELPARGEALDGLASERRVLVKPPANPRSPAPRFWVDGHSNADQPFVLTQPTERVLVSWPKEHVTKASLQSPLEAHLAVAPDSPRAASGRFTLYLRLGPAPPLRPDHVLVIIDRSRSTTPSMHREAVAALASLFDALPDPLTFDAISFARDARPLLPDDLGFPRVHDHAARDRVAAALDASARAQGTDLAAALALAGQRLATRGARRPLVLIITDGMLPLGAGPDALARRFADDLPPRPGAAPPQLIFLVDEPMRMRTGIAPDHPIARIAAGLDARISLTSLSAIAGLSSAAQADDTFAHNLLRAPGVLRELDISLPPQAVLEDSPPTGLVAGSVLALAGTYQRGLPHLRVRGKLGRARPQLRPRPQVMPTPPAALVASTRPAGLAQAALDGFAAPPWYGRRYQRDAQLGITWAGRGRRVERGHLDDTIFRRYLGIRVFPRARVCYNQALGRSQQLGGRVLFEFEVGKGEVMLATADTAGLNQRDPIFDRCLLEAAWMLDIPAGHLDDQIYRVRYPLVFNPPKTGRPALDDGVMGPDTVELLLNLQR